VDGDVLTVEGKKEAEEKKEGEDWMETKEIYRQVPCSKSSSSVCLQGKEVYGKCILWMETKEIYRQVPCSKSSSVIVSKEKKFIGKYIFWMDTNEIYRQVLLL
jgi:hypothetical protein